MTGFERLEPDTAEWTRFIGDHVARYRFAARALAAGPAGLVIDVACGVGYGARLLAEATGARVVAVDRDAGALATARSRYAHPRVEWRRDECPALATFADRVADAIVSLETIEHLVDGAAMLARCRQLLKPGGQLIASTPNRLLTRTPGAWDFHEREYDPEEFVALAQEAGFSEVRLFGQSLTPLGRLRADVRAELYRIQQNPAVRIGNRLRIWRGRAPWPPPLPELETDSQFEPFDSAAACSALGVEGPFVLAVVARA